MAPIIPLIMSVGGGVLGSSLGASLAATAGGGALAAGVGSVLGGGGGGALGATLGKLVTGKRPTGRAAGLGALGGATTGLLGGVFGAGSRAAGTDAAATSAGQASLLGRGSQPFSQAFGTGSYAAPPVSLNNQSSDLATLFALQKSLQPSLAQAVIPGVITGSLPFMLEQFQDPQQPPIGQRSLSYGSLAGIPPPGFLEAQSRLEERRAARLGRRF